MKILIPGHRYTLASFESPGKGQEIQFIQKERRHTSECNTSQPNAMSACNCGEPFTTIHDGTTNEEVLRVLIDRMQSLNAKAPCRENALVITKLEESLMWLEKRTADRKARGVEGTPKV